MRLNLGILAAREQQPNVINPMTAEEMWKSQPKFQKYPLHDFKNYNKNMKALVSQKVRRAATEEAIYQEDMRQHTHKEITCRGTPLWNKHAAKAMLIKDVEDGIRTNYETTAAMGIKGSLSSLPL
ncbi:hypothetical protein ACHAW5_006120 [Stephanodiscus triporus]|uniref:Uncharacterized protein n=1 Tax=Stephanodiscus triporus TaxID=2934178 RepID=A0ABD3NS22_9STRA